MASFTVVDGLPTDEVTYMGHLLALEVPKPTIRHQIRQGASAPRPKPMLELMPGPQPKRRGRPPGSKNRKASNA